MEKNYNQTRIHNIAKGYRMRSIFGAIQDAETKYIRCSSTLVRCVPENTIFSENSIFSQDYIF